jgi:hypothetical protein
MAKCECLETCPFFNDKMADMPGTAEMYKSRYCLEENAKCGRYMVFKALGRARIPADLFPNQQERAKKVIAKG